MCNKHNKVNAAQKTRINTKVQRKFYLRLCTVSMKKSKRKLNQN